MALDDLQTRLIALEQASLEAKQSQRDYVQGVAVGAIGALVFVVLLLLLFLVRHYL